MIIVNAVFVVVSYIGHRHKKRGSTPASPLSKALRQARRSSNVRRLPFGSPSGRRLLLESVAGFRVATAKLG